MDILSQVAIICLALFGPTEDPVVFDAETKTYVGPEESAQCFNKTLEAGDVEEQFLKAIAPQENVGDWWEARHKANVAAQLKALLQESD